MLCFAMIAVGYYGIIDLVGKRGVILQRGKSTACQKGPKIVGAVRGANSQSRREELRKVEDAALLTVKWREETKDCSVV
jgi:hypothetical protein